MDDKQKVVRRLLGKCECESMEDGCFAKSQNLEGVWCSGDKGHNEKHFVCLVNAHKIYEWVM